MEKNVIRLEASILLITARLNALEDILQGRPDVEFEKNGPGFLKENHQIFYEKYIEYIERLRDQLPASVASNPAMKDTLEKQIREAENRIDLLKK